jgi:hypothetical protein
MKTRNEIKADLIANPSFLTIITASIFHRHADIEEVVEWALSNYSDFCDIAGLQEEVKPTKEAVTSAQGKEIKARLTETLGKSVSICKNGKYSLAMHALGKSDDEIKAALLSSGCNILKTVKGKFGSGAYANALLYIVTA